MVVILVTKAYIKSQDVGICRLGQRAKPTPGKQERPELVISSSLLSPKLVLIFSFPGEALPLALALFAFFGFTLMLVVMPLSVWKMGRLLRYSCCPVVVLPDTLVMLFFSPFSMTLTRCTLSLSLAWVHILWLYKHLHKEKRSHRNHF